MTIPKVGKLGATVIAFCLGIAVSVFGPRLLDNLFRSTRYDRAEEMRVTSPTGNLDAVMIRQAYGALRADLSGEFSLFAGEKQRPPTIRTLFLKLVLSLEKS